VEAYLISGGVTIFNRSKEHKINAVERDWYKLKSNLVFNQQAKAEYPITEGTCYYS